MIEAEPPTEIEQFIPTPGEHVLIVGQTGSGKTAFATQLLASMPITPIVIYDTKGEPKFTRLPASKVVVYIDDLMKAANDPSIDYIVVRPPSAMLARPKDLDQYLVNHYENLRRVPAFVDEADQWVFGPQGGRGFVSLLSRGRSRGITSIFATQRPAFIPRKMVTEVTHAFVFRLQDQQDRKRMGDAIPNFAKEPPAPKRWFYHYVAGDDAAQLYAPISLDKKYDTGVVDIEPADDLAQRVSDRVWL